MSAVCQACHAETRDNAHLCKPCYRELREAIATIRARLSDLSDTATGRTRVDRAGSVPRPEQSWDDEHATIPAWLRGRDGPVALPNTRHPVNEAAREHMYDGVQTVYAWALHLAAAHGLDLADELTQETTQ